MTPRRLAAIVYFLAFAGSVGVAYALYPLFGAQSFLGQTDPPPTLIVFQHGSFGRTPVAVQVQLDPVGGLAHLNIDQPDLSEASGPGAEFVVALEKWTGHGFSFTETSLTCRASGDEPAKAVQPRIVSAAQLADQYRLGTESGVVGKTPMLTGSATLIRYEDPSATLHIECDLPQFRFARESLENRNVYLPGIETYAVAGGTQPVKTYSVAREGADFIVQASQSPSETLAGSYVWYQRDFALLARQGLFVTISNPHMQQESSYRLFVAGALLGVAAGFLVAGIQRLVERD